MGHRFELNSLFRSSCKKQKDRALQCQLHESPGACRVINLLHTGCDVLWLKLSNTPPRSKPFLTWTQANGPATGDNRKVRATTAMSSHIPCTHPGAFYLITLAFGDSRELLQESGLLITVQESTALGIDKRWWTGAFFCHFGLCLL